MAAHNRHHHVDDETDRQRRLGPQAEQALVDPYQVLGLQRQATAEDIKKAYFARVREFPPEREPDAFKRIRAAYDMLRTPDARAATDLFMLHPPVAYEPYKRHPAFDLDFHEGDWLVLALAYSDLGQLDGRPDYREPKV